MTEKESEKNLQSADPKELIKQFFDPAAENYKSIEMIMQAIAVSSVKHSCESVLESFVSRYENHFDARRSVEEDTANQEFEISVNGPSLAHCDSVVKEAMELYWRSKGSEWHFFKTSVIEKLTNLEGDSVVMNRLFKTKNNLPFMD